MQKGRACRQAGFSSLILIIMFVVLVIILLVPLPDYQSEDLLCAPYNNIESHEGACTKKGWHLGWPLWELIVNRLGFATRQEGDLRIVVPISPSPTLDETANWKTYTNAKYKYEVKYPTDWLVKEFGQIDSKTLSFVGFGSNLDDAIKAFVNIQVTLRSYEEQLQIGVEKTTPVTVDGLGGVKKIEGIPDASVGNTIVIILPAKNTIILSSNEKYEKVFNQGSRQL